MSPGGARDRKDREGDSKLLHNCEQCGHPEIEHDSVSGRCGHVNRSSTSITVCMCSAYGGCEYVIYEQIGMKTSESGMQRRA
jgi:hypothetical protein